VKTNQKIATVAARLCRLIVGFMLVMVVTGVLSF